MAARLWWLPWSSLSVGPALLASAPAHFFSRRLVATLLPAETKPFFAHRYPFACPDHQMIQQLNLKDVPSADQFACDQNILRAGGRIARWVRMSNDDRRTIEAHSRAEDFGGADVGAVDGALIDRLGVLDAILAIETQDPELLLVKVAHGDHEERG